MHARHVLAAVLLPGLLAAGPAAAAQKEEQLLVLPVNAPTLPRTLADAATDRAVARALALAKERYRVIARDMLAAVVGEERLLKCEDEARCELDLGVAIGSRYMLTTHVRPVGGKLDVLTKLYDVRKLALLAQSRTEAEGEGDVAARVEQVVGEALEQGLRHLETTGAIEFDVSEEDARVLLDGEVIGKGPLKSSRRVPEGSHRVLVTKDGFATWETELRVAAGATAIVAPRMAALPGRAGPLGPWAWELRLGLPWQATYETTGVARCADNGPLCAGLSPSFRVGYRPSGSWEVEAVVAAFALAHTDPQLSFPNVANTNLSAIGPGAAAVWHPLKSRRFGLAGEVGVLRAFAWADAGTNTSMTVRSWRPYAGAEGRVDFPFESFSIGLRAGVLVVGPGDGVSVSSVSPTRTVGISGSTMVLPHLDAAIGYRF